MGNRFDRHEGIHGGDDGETAMLIVQDMFCRAMFAKELAYKAATAVADVSAYIMYARRSPKGLNRPDALLTWRPGQ